MSDTTTLCAEGLDLVSEQVEATTDWRAASPCEQWTALDVLAHVTGTVQKALTAMGGGDYAGTPADAAGDGGEAETVTRWNDSAARAADAIISADPTQVVSSPRGELPLPQALALPIADLAVHAWDLAASGGRALDLPDELLAHVENLVRSIPEEQLRSGPFGPAVEPPPGASETDRLMAYLGRTRA